MKKRILTVALLLCVLTLFCAAAQADGITVPCSYCGADIDAETTSVTFTSAPDPETLRDLLAQTKIGEITLAYDAGADEIAALCEACPGVSFHWSLTLCGKTVTPETEELIYNDTPLSGTEPFYAVLPLLNKLTKLEMCGCGIGDEEMDALRTAFPEKGIVWSIKSQHWNIRTDTTYFATWRIVRTNDAGMITEAYGINENTNKTLDWLAYCHDIIALDIGHNRVENIEFVRNMPHLKYLIIADNKIQDLSPVEGLSELFYLEIFGNPITDLSPLAGLTELRHLNMCNVRATDLSPLNGLELERLFVSENYLTSRGAKTARQEYLALHPDCYFVIAQHGDYTGYDWRKTETYREMRHALNRAA